MKHILVAAALLIHTPAFAVVADQFTCSIQLFGIEGTPGPRSQNTFAIVRVPQATDPNWVDGVTGTSSRMALNLEAPGIKVAYSIGYHSYHSKAADKGAQSTCIIGSYVNLETGDGASELCAGTNIPRTPWDPTDYFDEAELLESGVPMFNSAVLNSYKKDIIGSTRWSKFAVKCFFHGTID